MAQPSRTIMRTECMITIFTVSKIGNLGIPLSAGRTDYELQKSCFGFS